VVTCQRKVRQPKAAVLTTEPCCHDDDDDDDDDGDDDDDDVLQLKQEILEVFRQLQRLYLEVAGRQNEWSPETVDISDLQAGQLLSMLTDLRAVVHRRLQLSPALSAVSCLCSSLQFHISLCRHRR